MSQHRIYIAGPMSGLPEFNHPAFHAAAAQLRGAGYIVTATPVGRLYLSQIEAAP